MVVFVKISEDGKLLELKNVSDVYRYIPYNCIDRKGEGDL